MDPGHEGLIGAQQRHVQAGDAQHHSQAGNHGDEWEGQIGLGNLIRSIEPKDIKGRLVILPSANFPAAMEGRRTSPIDEGNLNRSFPGDAEGTITQQIAYWIEHALLPGNPPR